MTPCRAWPCSCGTMHKNRNSSSTGCREDDIEDVQRVRALCCRMEHMRTGCVQSYICCAVSLKDPRICACIVTGSRRAGGVPQSTHRALLCFRAAARLHETGHRHGADGRICCRFGKLARLPYVVNVKVAPVDRALSCARSSSHTGPSRCCSRSADVAGQRAT